MPQAWIPPKEDEIVPGQWKPPASDEVKPSYGSEISSGAGRGVLDLLPGKDTFMDLATEGPMGIVKTTGRGILDSIRNMYQGAKDPEGGWAGRTLRVGENLPLLGPVVKKAEEAGPTKPGEYVKFAPQTAGAVAEGVTQAVIPFAAEKAISVLPRGSRAPAIDTTHENFVQGIQQAVPPKMVGGVPSYTPDTLHRVAPHIFDQHAAVPIESVDDLRNATDTAISRHDRIVKDAIAEIGPTVVNNNVLADVQRELSNSTVRGFADEGLKSLERHGLDRPLTLDQVEAKRAQLSAENRAALSTKPGYKLADAEKIDPAFAAREAALRSLREGQYTAMADNGYEGMDEFRRDEGALIEFRNALNDAQLTGNTPIAGTEKAGPLRMAARGSTATLGGIAGYALGDTVGGPALGAVGTGAGGVLGKTLGDKLFPSKALTVDELIRQSLPTTRTTPPALLPRRQFTPTRQLAAPGVTVTSDVPRESLRRVVLNQEDLPSNRLLESGPIDPETGKPQVPKRGPGSGKFNERGGGIEQPYSWLDRSGTPEDVRVPPLAEGIRQTRLARMRHAAGENLLAPPGELGIGRQTVSQRPLGALEMFSPEESWRLRTDLNPFYQSDVERFHGTPDTPAVLRPKWVLPQLQRILKGRGKILYP